MGVRGNSGLDSHLGSTPFQIFSWVRGEGVDLLLGGIAPPPLQKKKKKNGCKKPCPQHPQQLGVPSFEGAYRQPLEKTFLVKKRLTRDEPGGPKESLAGYPTISSTGPWRIA